MWVWKHTPVKTMVENLKEAKEIVMENEDSISALIAPCDLRKQDITDWSEVDKELLTEELGASMGDAWMYPNNHPYAGMIEELAVNRFVEDMTRVPMDHLNPEIFQGIEDMVTTSPYYWPYETSRQEARELVYEWNDDIEFFYEYEQEIRWEIESFILEARLEGI